MHHVEVIDVGIQYQYAQETSPINMTCIKQEENTDYHYQNLLETIGQCFSGRKELLTIRFREFWNMRNDLYVINALIFKEGCVLIPKNIRFELDTKKSIASRTMSDNNSFSGTLQ